MRRSGRAVTAATVTIALLVVGACSAGGDGRGGRTAALVPAAGRTVLSPPAKGQIDGFTWALPFEAATLDPIRSWNYPENTILANLCESVVRLTPELAPEPGLASEIDTSDPTRVVLTVRDGFYDE